MWEEDYIGSLTLLPGTLAELGATVKLDGVSLERDAEEELFPSSIMSILDSALTVVYPLEDRDFFFFHDLSGIARKVESVLAVTRTWQETRFVYQVERVLKPMHTYMSAFAPEKVCETLRAMRHLLEEIRELVLDGHDCLELLPVLLEHLEELQPGSRLEALEGLDDLLWVNSQQLRCLASHPLTVKKLGRRNVFAQLISIRKEVNDVVADDFLEEMQELFENLDTVHAIDFQDVDFND